MRLSEAIRLGAMTTEPLVGRMVSPDGAAACALGAAVVAVGCNPFEIYNRFPSLILRQDPPCSCRTGGCHLGMAIAHLNDVHGWTRDRIADWVETVEAPVPEPEVASVR